MGFLAAQRPVVVVGDVRVDRDIDRGEVLHQAVGFGFPDLQAALLDRGVTGSGFRQCVNALLDQLDLPAGVLACLLKQRLIVPVEPEDLLREVIFRELFGFQIDALPAVPVGEEDRQLLAGL